MSLVLSKVSSKFCLIVVLTILGNITIMSLASARENVQHNPKAKPHYVKSLSNNHKKVAFSHHGHRYYFHNGYYYNHNHHGYYRIAPPIGLTVSFLPRGYSRVRIGGHLYYHLNDTYYRYYPKKQHYVVVREPDLSNSDITNEGDESDVGYQTRVFYPKAGQDSAQQEQEQYQCHRWSVEQSNFDPSAIVLKRASSGDADHYDRAMMACMEAKNYVVK